jgi:hypothetical protein
VRQTKLLGVAGASAAIAVALLFATGSTAATQVNRTSTRNIVGTYQIVTHYTGGIDKGQTLHGTFQIKTFNRATGALAGIGTSEFGPSFKITGTVKGSRIEMRVSGGGDTGHDLGTIRADGSISGTLRDSYGSTGRWTMTRASVVVEKAGWGVDRSGPNSSFYGVGLKLLNRSNRDAVHVTVTLNERGGGLGNLSGEQFTVALIPAGKSFVIGDDHGNIGSTHFRSIGATIHVGAMLPHESARRLPRVSDLRIDRKNDFVDAVITNRYPFALNIEKATAYTVLYNSARRIIGGGNSALWSGNGPTKLKVGGHERVAIDADGNMSKVTHVQVSVSATP